MGALMGERRPDIRDEIDRSFAGVGGGDVRVGLAVEALPQAYRSNSRKEELALAFVANFVRQFRHLYNNRKPVCSPPRPAAPAHRPRLTARRQLFITLPNECDVPKFVCTTVRPTQLPFKQLYNHDGASAFVADFVTYQQLPEDEGLAEEKGSDIIIDFDRSKAAADAESDSYSSSESGAENAEESHEEFMKYEEMEMVVGKTKTSRIHQKSQKGDGLSDHVSTVCGAARPQTIVSSLEIGQCL